ncbi:hypothetical protein VitviT2T_008587 [Vitis vinifera]|uniref:Uncharacterized protein n=1 Tax=Vitis vinifera TaxID=29760 RepID=A0ABY9C3R4_VITVI|nr:hypothetical protein VitviT2T_008587 [Vitis vinifera]
MYKAAKLQSRYGDGRLRCSRCDWWNSRNHKGSSRSSLRHGHWWYSPSGKFALLCLWGHWRCYHGRVIRGSQLVSQLIRVQLVFLECGPQKGVINKIYNLYHHALG